MKYLIYLPVFIFGLLIFSWEFEYAMKMSAFLIILALAHERVESIREAEMLERFIENKLMELSGKDEK